MNPGKKILIVDDEQKVTELIAAAAKKLGYECACCFNAEDALELCKYNVYAAAVIDILLPEMNGIDLTNQLISTNPELNILVISGGGDTGENIVKQILLSAAEYRGALYSMARPFNMSLLEEILGKLSEKKAS